jgi:hypothetical protein
MTLNPMRIGLTITGVEHVDFVAPYTMTLRFDDGTEQRIDIWRVLEGRAVRTASKSERVQRCVTRQRGRDADVAERC